MAKNENGVITWRIIGLFLLGAIALVLGVNHFFGETPLLGDAGAFGGIAVHMQHGNVLYRDVWDNKAPGVFFLHRLVLAIGGSSIHSFHVLQCILVGSSIVFLWLVFYRFYGWKFLPVVALTPLWLRIFMEWPYYFSGHYTEEYGCYFLLFSIAIFLLRPPENVFSYSRALVSGCLSCMAVFMKEPFAVLALMILIFVLKTGGKKYAIWFVCGAFVPVVLFAAYLTVFSAWKDYLGYLRFAFSYSAKGNSHISTRWHDYENLITNWHNVWNMGYWILIAALLPVLGKKFHQSNGHSYWIFFLLALTGNIFLVMGSTVYGHYFLSLIFFSSILIMFGILWLISLPSRLPDKFQYKKITTIAFYALFAIVIAQPAYNSLQHFWKEKYNQKYSEHEEQELFNKKLQKYKTVFVDAQDMGRIYVYTGKISGMPYPSPYYTYFLTEGEPEIGRANAQKFIKAFKEHTPDAVASAQNPSMAFVVSGEWAWVHKHFDLVDSVETVESNKVYIWEKR